MITLSCQAERNYCMVVSSAIQNDLGPESDNAPSAGAAKGTPTTESEAEAPTTE